MRSGVAIAVGTYAGATKRFSAVRWGVAGNILLAWLFTIPAAALVAAAMYWPIEAIF